MRNARLAAVLRTVQAKYPEKRIAVERYESPDDRFIRWWIHILDVGDRELREVDSFALRTAYRIYGDAPIPIFIGPAGPERSEELLSGKYGPPPRVVPCGRRRPRAAVRRRAGRARSARRAR